MPPEYAVRSQGGTAGGWELVKDPKQINLLEIYHMVKPGTVFALHNKEPNPVCPIGRNIQQGLGSYYQRAQGAMEKELSQICIAEVLGDVLGLRKS
jgi:DNA-binding IscR family transcriptional regulator